MITLGLDPSLTSYGWVVYDSTKRGVDKVIDRGRWKTDTSEFEIVRYLAIRENLRACVRRYGIRRAGMETPPVGSVSWNQERLYALFIYNMEVMFTEKVDVVLFAPTQLTLLAKQVGAGVEKRSWDKAEMVWTARSHLLDLVPDISRRAVAAEGTNPDTNVSRAIERALQGQFPFIDDEALPKPIKKAVKFQSDEADAYHAARYADRFFELVGGRLSEDDLTPSEWDVFMKSHTYTRGPKKGTTEAEGILHKEGSRFYRFSSSP
jgi:Holliday junction resolvasome RuvABC endonuclease subunit